MKICISAMGSKEESFVDQRFGRYKYFVLVDTDTNSVESVANESVDARGGAGIQSAQAVVAMGVRVVLTGAVGPNAFRILHSAEVSILTGKLVQLLSPEAPSSVRMG